MIYGLVQKSKKIKIFFSPYLTEEQIMSNWENGKTYPDIISVIKMSDLYDISLDHLLKEEKSMLFIDFFVCV